MDNQDQILKPTTPMSPAPQEPIHSFVASDISAPADSAMPQSPQASVDTVPQYQAPVAPEHPKGSSSMLFALATILIAAILGLVAYMFLFNKENSPLSQTTPPVNIQTTRRITPTPTSSLTAEEQAVGSVTVEDVNGNLQTLDNDLGQL